MVSQHKQVDRIGLVYKVPRLGFSTEVEFRPETLHYVDFQATGSASLVQSA